MNSKINIYIWGTGQKAREYLSRGEVADRQLLGFIQSKRTEETFYGKRCWNRRRSFWQSGIIYWSA